MVFIYILKLENKKYYVGKTTNPELRIDSHFMDNRTDENIIGTSYGVYRAGTIKGVP